MLNPYSGVGDILLAWFGSTCSLRGTRIIYDRKFLLDRRNAPIAQTPPAHLPVIPGVTSQNVLSENQKNEANNHINNHDGKPTTGDDAQFEMDI
uniref:eukaryotic translation initiation factor 4E-binding protein 2 isoform X3 n=1 Tax=Monopterus albus TaxID=43700 RepID=UPI0009B33CF2|nr:eukaryotic translation initiation factor 4E-binding protein 2 isoform X3 [Monopterus albus]